MKHIFILTLAFTSLIFSSNANAQFWQQTNGPGGGQIKSVAVNSLGDIFVGSNTILRSTDNGKSWTDVASQLKTVTSIQINSQDILFALTIDSGGGIWRSTNNGNTWEMLSSKIFSRMDWKMSLTPDGSIFAISSNGGYSTPYRCFRSIDNGNTWADITPNLVGDFQNVWGDKKGNLFFNTSQYFYRSTDNGQNWSKTVNGLTGPVNSFAEYPNGHLFVDQGDGFLSAIDESTDGGRTWQQITYGAKYYLGTSHSISMNHQGRLVVVGDLFGLVSDDEGKNWHSYTNHSIRILNSDINGNFYGTNGSSLFKSTLLDSTSTWTKIEVPNSSVTAITKHPNGNLLAFTQDNNVKGAAYNHGWVWLSLDEGTHWSIIPIDSAINTGYSNSVIYAIAVDSSHNVLAGTGGNIIRSTNGGQNWTRNATTLTQGLITGLDVRNTGEIFASTSSEGIFRSIDNGITWDQLNSGIKNQNIYSLAVHQNGDVYAGSQNIIYKSTDVGLTWQTLNTNFPALAGKVTAIVVNTQGNIIAGIDNVGVFWSTDNGTTWVQKALGLTATKINALVSTPSGKVFAGTDSGIFFLDIIPGANWLKFNQGMTATNVLSLCRDQLGRIFAGTDVNGVFSSINTFNIAHPNGTLSSPLLISPIDKFGTDQKYITLLWHSVPNAKNYQVTVARSSNFSDIDTLSALLSDTTFTFNTHHTSTSFYWHVQSMKDADVSAFSETRNFEIHITDLVKEPTNISFISNPHPNPFSTSTTIPFTLGARSYISLEIFDALGRSYAVLAHGNYNAGNYEAKFNAENLSAGMYFVRLRTDKQSFTKTLEIVK